MVAKDEIILNTLMNILKGVFDILCWRFEADFP